MAKHITSISAILVVSILALSCLPSDSAKREESNWWERIVGEGPMVEEELTVADFDAVNLDGSFSIQIQQGESQKVMAKGHKNIIDRIKTDVRQGKWYADLQPGNYGDYELFITITLPRITEVGLDGLGSITFKDFQTWEDLDISIDGLGSITIEDSSGSLTRMAISLDGSGSLNVEDDLAISVDFFGY
jgi:hypothetical protein